MRTEPSVAELRAGVVAGDRAMLGRAISLIESRADRHFATAQALIQEILPLSGQALRVGISGVPGVGKSSFIEALGVQLIAQGRKLAVLAVDPSSALRGGSLLGDKTRMRRLSVSEGAFIRPSPSGGALGGVHRRTREVILLMEAAGFDTVLVETVGVGQSEVAVASMVDTFLMLMLSGAGDDLQGIKRGILELVDVLAITKADGENLVSAQRARQEYESALHVLRSSSEWAVPVSTCSARDETGLREVWEAILKHRAWLEESGAFEARRAEQRVRWMQAVVHAGLERRFERSPGLRALRESLEAQVHAGRRSPTAAAYELLAAFEAEAPRA